jgi:putative endonuclease
MTLYTGVTNDLMRRVFEHKSKTADGFTKKYGVSRLLYYELFESAEEAILREKRIKKWNRDWKLNLIKKTNPGMKDLYDEIA